MHRGASIVRGFAIGAAATVLSAAGCSSPGSDSGVLDYGGVAGHGGNAGSPSSHGPSPDAAVTNAADAGSSGGQDAASAEDAPADSGNNGPPPPITFTLIDTAITGIVAGSPVAGYDPFADGAMIDESKVGTSLSIRANPTPSQVGSLHFTLDGTYSHTENVFPYMLCGDDGKGDIKTCALPGGNHWITATPYTQPNLGGTAGQSVTIHFTITSAGDAGAD